MPSDGKRHQRITVKRGCVKMNSKQVLRKGQYRLSHNTFAKKENQLSTPPVFKSDTTCSQFKLLLRYLIQIQLAHCCIAWSTSTFQLPFFRFLHCKWNSLAMDIPVYHFFCIIILLQDEGLAPNTLLSWDAPVVGVPRYAHITSLGTMSTYPNIPKLGTPIITYFSSGMWDNGNHLWISGICKL